MLIFNRVGRWCANLPRPRVSRLSCVLFSTICFWHHVILNITKKGNVAFSKNRMFFVVDFCPLAGFLGMICTLHHTAGMSERCLILNFVPFSISHSKINQLTRFHIGNVLEATGECTAGPVISISVLSTLFPACHFLSPHSDLSFQTHLQTTFKMGSCSLLFYIFVVIFTTPFCSLKKPFWFNSLFL